MSQCQMCQDAPATEGKYCLYCAEEMACLMHEAAVEFGWSKEKAQAAAQSAWR